MTASVCRVLSTVLDIEDMVGVFMAALAWMTPAMWLDRLAHLKV